MGYTRPSQASSTESLLDPHPPNPDTFHTRLESESYPSHLSNVPSPKSTPYPVQPHQAARLRLHWRTPRLLIATFLIGIAAALAQHGLYKFLHLRSLSNENTKTSLVLCGRAISYLAKVAFAQCIILCYRQRIWRTFRDNPLSIRSIDQLFSGTEDASLLVNWEAISNAPLVTSMALVVWLLPLATVIASPSALSFGWRAESDVRQVSVPILNFTKESSYNWRKPSIWYDGIQKRSLFYYNTTELSGTSPGFFDYYDTPSITTEMHISKNLFSTLQEILNGTFNQEIARQKSCGGNYNCTYSINFLGPAYKCEEALESLGGPVNKSLLVPEGKYTYYANVNIGDYDRPQFENYRDGPGGIPVGNISDHAGSLKFEPELWIGCSYNSTMPLADDSPFLKNWTHKFERKVARCILHETNYTVDFNFTGQICDITSSRQYLTPSLGFNFTHPNDGVLPEDRWLSPRDNIIEYKKMAGYHALAERFRHILMGDIVAHAPKPGPWYLEVFTDINKTPLLDRTSQCQSNFTAILENLFGDMVLTLITQPGLLVSSEQEVLVERSRYRIVFIYDPKRLWLCYGPVILVTLSILLLGAWTIYQDGTTFSTGFSRIVATTRNPTLDSITEGACLGNDPFPKGLLVKKLQFGALQETVVLGDTHGAGTGYESVGHCAFGTPSEVAPIRRDVVYRGRKTRV